MTKRIKLTKMIFDYWKFHMVRSVDTEDYPVETLFYYNGYNADFWYLLNYEWYKMNNKLFSFTDCTEQFDPCLRDFDADYLKENGYV